MKRLYIISILCFATILLAACGNGKDEEKSGTTKGNNALEALQEKGTVKIGFANEKPYAYQDGTELKGAAVDIAIAVFKELGIDNVEGQLADFGQLIPGLKADKFDVITAGMAITAERCKNVAFGEPEMKYGEGLIVKKGNPLNLHSYKDIATNKDAVVSVMAGATENNFLKSEGVDPKQIQSASDIPATFSAVESGRADATTGTEMTIKMALESAGSDTLEFVTDFEQPDIEGVPSYGAAAFQDKDDALREAYNEKLAELKENGKIAEILEANGFSGDTNSVEPEMTTEKVCNGK